MRTFKQCEKVTEGGCAKSVRPTSQSQKTTPLLADASSSLCLLGFLFDRSAIWNKFQSSLDLLPALWPPVQLFVVSVSVTAVHACKAHSLCKTTQIFCI